MVAFVFQVTVMHDGDQLSWTQLIICLWMGSSELISYFALLVCAAFALSIKLYLPCHFSFLILTLFFFSVLYGFLKLNLGTSNIYACNLKLTVILL